MIIFKCDLCNKKVDRIDSIVLYRTKLDYCKECKDKIIKIKRAIKTSIDYFNKEAHKNIMQAEKQIISRYK